jgi:hypothetical protein
MKTFLIFLAYKAKTKNGIWQESSVNVTADFNDPKEYPQYIKDLEEYIKSLHGYKDFASQNLNMQEWSQ